MVTITLTVEELDDIDANDFMFYLFGEANKAGDFVVKHKFSVARTNGWDKEVTRTRRTRTVKRRTTKRRGRPPKALAEKAGL